jgi:hypothetical protein
MVLEKNFLTKFIFIKNNLNNEENYHFIWIINLRIMEIFLSIIIFIFKIILLNKIKTKFLCK